jgi:hypothetical protein
MVARTDQLGERIGDGLLTLGHAVAAASYDVERSERRMKTRTLFDLRETLEAIARTASGVDALGLEMAELMNAAQSVIVESVQTTSDGVSRTLGHLIRVLETVLGEALASTPSDEPGSQALVLYIPRAPFSPPLGDAVRRILELLGELRGAGAHATRPDTDRTASPREGPPAGTETSGA